MIELTSTQYQSTLIYYFRGESVTFSPEIVHDMLKLSENGLQ